MKGCLSLILIIVITLVIIVKLDLTEEDLDSYKWPFVVAGTFLYLLLQVIFSIFSNGERKCAWCGSGSLKVISEEEKERFWEYRNKDGSRDKRVKDNGEIVKVLKIVGCKKCEATSQLQYSGARVGQKSKIRKRVLVSEGKGARSESDWECRSVEIDSVGAKRKNSS